MLASNTTGQDAQRATVLLPQLARLDLAQHVDNVRHHAEQQCFKCSIEAVNSVTAQVPSQSPVACHKNGKKTGLVRRRHGLRYVGTSCSSAETRELPALGWARFHAAVGQTSNYRRRRPVGQPSFWSIAEWPQGARNTNPPDR